jgi:hypothetical protein
MGCKTCKQKKEKKEKSGVGSNLNAINNTLQESGLENGVFVYKLIAFIVVTAALPLILAVLIGQIFIYFFMPKKLDKITKKFRGFFTGLLKRYTTFKENRERKKRERQFANNRGYEEGSELVEVSDVEVQENNNKKK